MREEKLPIMTKVPTHQHQEENELKEEGEAVHIEHTSPQTVSLFIMRRLVCLYGIWCGFRDRTGGEKGWKTRVKMWLVTADSDACCQRLRKTDTVISQLFGVGSLVFFSSVSFRLNGEKNHYRKKRKPILNKRTPKKEQIIKSRSFDKGRRLSTPLIFQPATLQKKKQEKEKHNTT